MRDVEEPSLAELMAEPIVRQLMIRDGISERELRALAVATRRRISGRLARGATPAIVRSRPAGLGPTQ